MRRELAFSFAMVLLAIGGLGLLFYMLNGCYGPNAPPVDPDYPPEPPFTQTITDAACDTR